jgi:hypothetical protein
MIKGSCLCNQIQFELDESAALFINNCHCSKCRKWSGAAFGSFLQIPGDKFWWIAGDKLISVYESSPDKPRSFCSVCGSCIPTVITAKNHVVVPAGTLDDNPGIKPIVHIYTGSKAPWYTITDELPKFEEQAPDEFWVPFLRNVVKNET